MRKISVVNLPTIVMDLTCVHCGRKARYYGARVDPKNKKKMTKRALGFGVPSESWNGWKLSVPKKGAKPKTKVFLGIGRTAVARRKTEACPMCSLMYYEDENFGDVARRCLANVKYKGEAKC